jgi:hypothetical protein
MGVSSPLIFNYLSRFLHRLFPYTGLLIIEYARKSHQSSWALLFRSRGWQLFFCLFPDSSQNLFYEPQSLQPAELPDQFD